MGALPSRFLNPASSVRLEDRSASIVSAASLLGVRGEPGHYNGLEGVRFGCMFVPSVTGGLIQMNSQLGGFVTCPSCSSLVPVYTVLSSQQESPANLWLGRSPASVPSSTLPSSLAPTGLAHFARGAHSSPVSSPAVSRPATSPASTTGFSLSPFMIDVTSPIQHTAVSESAPPVTTNVPGFGCNSIASAISHKPLLPPGVVEPSLSSSVSSPFPALVCQASFHAAMPPGVSPLASARPAVTTTSSVLSGSIPSVLQSISGFTVADITQLIGSSVAASAVSAVPPIYSCTTSHLTSVADTLLCSPNAPIGPGLANPACPSLSTRETIDESSATVSKDFIGGNAGAGALSTNPLNTGWPLSGQCPSSLFALPLVNALPVRSTAPTVPGIYINPSSEPFVYLDRVDSAVGNGVSLVPAPEHIPFQDPSDDLSSERVASGSVTPSLLHPAGPSYPSPSVGITSKTKPSMSPALHSPSVPQSPYSPSGSIDLRGTPRRSCAARSAARLGGLSAYLVSPRRQSLSSKVKTTLSQSGRKRPSVAVGVKKLKPTKRRRSEILPCEVCGQDSAMDHLRKRICYGCHGCVVKYVRLGHRPRRPVSCVGACGVGGPRSYCPLCRFCAVLKLGVDITGIDLSKDEFGQRGRPGLLSLQAALCAATDSATYSKVLLEASVPSGPSVSAADAVFAQLPAELASVMTPEFCASVRARLLENPAFAVALLAKADPDAVSGSVVDPSLPGRSD